jgi:putative flippase GtrA
LLAALGRRKRLTRYVIVGLAVYLVEVAILVGLRSMGASDLVSVTVSFWIGLVASFGLQKLVAFEDHQTGMALAGQGAGYLALVGINYAFTMVMVWLLAPAVGVVVVRTSCLGVTTVWNYAAYRLILFTRPQPQRGEG